MLEEEKNLIIRAQNGDSLAFGLLYDRYIAQIYRFVVIKTSDKEEAEDITHQVFLKAWTSVSTNYTITDLPFSSWLYRIARHAIIDQYRRKKITSNIEDCEHEESLIIRPKLEAKLDLDDQFKMVWEAVKNLNPTEQEVITLRFVEDLSVKETALAIQKSEGATKVIQHRALEKLKQTLTKLD